VALTVTRTYIRGRREDRTTGDLDAREDVATEAFCLYPTQ
jgi:hypothetical protein